jgi:hypothetical protein
VRSFSSFPFTYLTISSFDSRLTLTHALRSFRGFQQALSGEEPVRLSLEMVPDPPLTSSPTRPQRRP